MELICKRNLREQVSQKVEQHKVGRKRDLLCWSDEDVWKIAIKEVYFQVGAFMKLINVRGCAETLKENKFFCRML